MPVARHTNIYFSDVFGVSSEILEDYGAFDISLVNDLPLFIDPFLLFNSERSEYRALHDEIIRYVRFLRDKAVAEAVTPGLMKAWFMFPEVKQTWLGYSLVGNGGSGLGPDFARATQDNLGQVFSDFGKEKVTRGSHIEKLCLFADGVGKDNISDFTTNLIKGFLVEYTQTFARAHLAPEQRRLVPVEKAVFNYDTETWRTVRYELPIFGADYVILTPVDILTKDDIWINRTDLVRGYPHIVASIPDDQLRETINNYFEKILPADYTRGDEEKAAARAILHFPQLIEHYIRFKEDHGDEAEALSEEKVRESKQIYISQVKELIGILADATGFYEIPGATLAETRARVAYLKDVIENKDGYRLFVGPDGRPIRRESDLQIIFRFTWFNTLLDVNREVNNGRGPVDYTVSRGKRGKTLVEFKLASNTSLRKNLKAQAEIYQKAGDAEHAIKVILYFTAEERAKVEGIVRDLGLTGSPNIVLIDARADNKPSASKAASVELE
jgi:hypothetical protein